MRKLTGQSNLVTLRLDPDVLKFYRTEAQRNGKSLSVYLRELLEAGHLYEQIESTKLDIREMFEEFKSDMQKIQDSQKLWLPDRILKSIARTEVMLEEIIERNGGKPVLFKLYDKAVELVQRFKRDED